VGGTKTGTLTSSSVPKFQLFVRKQNSTVTTAKRVTLLLPGWADESSLLPHPTPLTEPVEVAVARAVGITFNSFADIPGAACRWRGSEKDQNIPAKIVCADPVHLMAGSDDAQLIPPNRLNLRNDESEALLDELNRVLCENQSTFLHDSNYEWYYSGIDPAALTTSSPEALAGHPMTLAMPRDAASRPWRAFLAEVQMVLHQSPVNQARQARGQLPINSVWFWGGGALPNKAEYTGKVILYTDDGYAQSFAAAVGIECKPLAAVSSTAIIESDHHHHIILDTTLLAASSTLKTRQSLGDRWEALLRESALTAAINAAELEGLTGCRMDLTPKRANSPTALMRFLRVFRR